MPTIPADPHDPRDAARIAAMANDPDVRAAVRTLNAKAFEYKYYLNFRWLGRPIVQYPQDVIALQEIVWDTKPTLIVETGVAHGGSLILYASLFELMKVPGEVVGVEIDLRPHNEAAISAHPMSERISIVKGSSIDPAVVARVAAIAARHERVMVVLDSHHSHEHVTAELLAYAPLVTAGNYLVVMGTAVAELPADAALDRPWNSERNPGSALAAWLAEGRPFEVDTELSERLILSDGPGGYLRRTG
jgi:cephalosporin hydroxylase